jgi:hypothetical protein
MIPDIWMPAILIESDTKYDAILNEKTRKVSVIALTLRKLQCLKM